MESIGKEYINEYDGFITMNVNSFTISGNMNKLTYFIDVNVDITGATFYFEKNKLIHFFYDCNDGTCYYFHDCNMNFYNSNNFRSEDFQVIKLLLQASLDHLRKNSVR